MCKEFDGESDDRACGYLRRLVDEIHTVVLATMGDDGYPRTCAVDMMLADRHGVYFLTARGKSLYSRLKATGRVSLTGIRGDTTMTSVAVTLTGDVEEVPERLGELLEANPYMYRIYPTEESRRALTAFHIVRGEGEFFDLSARRTAVEDGSTDVDQVCRRSATHLGLTSPISTGEFRFPNRPAAEIAVSTVRGFLAEHPDMRVVFDVFKEEDHDIYRELLGRD